MAEQSIQPIEGREHWTTSGGERLFMWEKRAPRDVVKRGTLLFVHGSSMASQPTFDLYVEGRTNSSAMDWFAAHGFDTWCFDARGYGRSAKPKGFDASISDGAEDIKAVSDFLLENGGDQRVYIYGISSGALKAALFAERYPDRVARLALDAYVWTGNGSPTLADRRRKLPNFRSGERRPIDHAFVHSIFNRDHPGTAEERVVDAFADAILSLDDSMPNGTYIDMCSHLPVNDPTAISAPTIIMRGEYDGIASLEDLLAFFEKLPNADKQFVIMPGISHASFQQKNYMLVYHILHSFLTQPAPDYRGA
ncbi:alpha/beta hydrolase [Microvirga massiliensis]|uniref:alpha/beta hydrolase n=1 Tax=Microvirga massiliensis TaxID=1033741 RepID=UPI00062BB0F3|nr:alpha/beta fold hydrolase [Microvirga massiliensis]